MNISDTSTTKKLNRLQSFIGWAALFSVLLGALALGANRPVSWVLLSFATCGLFILQVIRDLITADRKVSGLLLVTITLYLIAVVWAIMQTVSGMPASLAHDSWDRVSDGLNTISADPSQTHHGILRLITYGMLFWIGLCVSMNVKRVQNFLQVFAVFSTALAVFGIYAFMTNSNPILGIQDQTNFVNASFVNRNSYATFAVFGFLANITCYLNQAGEAPPFTDGFLRSLRNGLENFFDGTWAYILGALICFMAVVLTQSRAGAVAGLIGVLTFFLSYRLKDQSNNRALLAVLGVIVGFVILTSASTLTERLLATSDEEGRFIVYPFVFQGILDRPLLGHGLGAFHETFRAYVPMEVAFGEWHLAHNSYLENFYELGVPAALAFYCALAVIVGKIWWGTRTRQRNRVYPCFALGCAAVAAFHAMFDFSLQMPASAGLFALLMGLGWAQSISMRRTTRTRSSSKKRRKS